MYHVNQGPGGIQVPQPVFDALGRQAVPHAFPVALFMVGRGAADAETVARGLGIPPEAAQQALDFWAGQGLLAQKPGVTAPEAEKKSVCPPPAARQPVQGNKNSGPPPATLTAAEVAKAVREDSILRGLLAELARLYARALTLQQQATFTCLYKLDGFAAEMILLTAQHYKAKGITNARYIQKVMHTWKQDGIQDFAAADERLRRETLREQRYTQIGALAGLEQLSLGDKNRVDRWFEEYGYTPDMVKTAQLYAGSNGHSLPYLDGILKAWHAKGHKTPADVRAAGYGAAIRETPAPAVAPEDDILLNATYVPINEKK